MNGKICYLEIPAVDADASARFYADLFGWEIRTRGDGARAFNDATGSVSGSWVTGRTPAAADSGVVVYVMVDDIAATLQRIAGDGGEVVTPRTAIGSGAEWFAVFRDPAGNCIGMYEQARR